ncbi:hypothetical protein CQB05_00030 [Paracidovorax citrulli]|nr:hypothetical protein CQB05_00030 [Paracidovorax citrulli]
MVLFLPPYLICPALLEYGTLPLVSTNSAEIRTAVSSSRPACLSQSTIARRVHANWFSLCGRLLMLLADVLALFCAAAAARNWPCAARALAPASVYASPRALTAAAPDDAAPAADRMDAVDLSTASASTSDDLPASSVTTL